MSFVTFLATGATPGYGALLRHNPIDVARRGPSDAFQCVGEHHDLVVAVGPVHRPTGGDSRHMRSTDNSARYLAVQAEALIPCLAVGSSDPLGSLGQVARRIRS